MHGVFGVEGKDAGFLVVGDAFEGGFVSYEDGCYFAILYCGLFADEDDVTIVDARAYHGVALGAEAEVSFGVVFYGDVALPIFVGVDGFAAGDVTKEGDLLAADGEDVVWELFKWYVVYSHEPCL